MPKLCLTLLLAVLGLGMVACRVDPRRQATLAPDVVRQLDQTIDQYMRDNNLPSVVVGLWIPGQGEYVVTRGTANLDTGRLRERNDPFRIASITKTFTALAILQLVDEGKLSTTDPIAKWFPDFPNADRITVDDLLRMRSGIPDAADQAFLEDWYSHVDANITTQDMIRRSAAKAAQFTPPNQITRYTNVNYNLLEEIIRQVSGQPIHVRITEKILKPLAMTNSLYPVDNQLPGQLRGYSWNAQTGKYEDKTVLNPVVAGGAGAMISSLSDLKTYAKSLCTGRLLRSETHRAQMQGQPLAGSPDFVRYGEGIGWFGKFCGHTGTIFGFSTDMFYLPEKDAVLVVNVNRLDVDDHSHSTPLSLMITKIVFPNDVNW